MVFTLGSSVGSDVKWRSTLERALGTWESVTEWADYISYLARLQKAIKSNTDCPGDQLPLREEISESLARCLEPDLPSGVHQTCISVYGTVFATIGHKELCNSIGTWLPGLLPIISHAAFNVKPMVVDLFEKYIIIAVSTRPEVLRALLHPIMLSLLPSLEEENGECYSEIYALVGSMRKELNSDALFWRCFCMCVITSAESRLGALNLLNKNTASFDAEIKHQEDQRNQETKETKETQEIGENNEGKREMVKGEYNCSEISGLFVRACCNGLKDENVLVQRGFLDIIARHLPLSSPILQKNPVIFESLLLCACLTLLRRDMSLNRRLWLWLLGPEPVDDQQLSRLHYLEQYGASTLIRVILQHLSSNASATFQITRALMDRWEIGATLSHALLHPVLLFSQKNGVDPGATQFFNTLEPTVVWDVALRLMKTDQSLVLFMVRNFDVKETAVADHIPLFLVYMLAEGPPFNSELLTELLQCVRSLDLPTEPVEFKPSNENLCEQIVQFYTDSVANSIDGDEKPVFQLSSKNISWYLLYLASEQICSGDCEFKAVLNSFLNLIPAAPGLDMHIPNIAKLVKTLNGKSLADVALFMHLVSKIDLMQTRVYVATLVHELACQLAPAKFHSILLAQELWKVDEIVGGSVVSSALSVELANASTSPEFRANFFACVWISAADYTNASDVLMKPLLLFLDLADEDSAVFLAYLQSAVVRTGTMGQMIKMLIDKLELEKQNDSHVFNYCLKRTLEVLKQPEVRSVYITRYFQPMCALLLQWFEDPEPLDKPAYAEALELAELTVLDPTAKDGRQWLENFVFALLKEDADADAAIDTDTDVVANENGVNSNRNVDDSRAAIPVPLMRFITSSLPFLQRTSQLDKFVCTCIRSIQSEVEYEQFSRLLQVYLDLSKGENKSLVAEIVDKLQTVPDYAALELIHLFSYLDAIMSSDAGRKNEEYLACLELCVDQSSRYWLQLQEKKTAPTMEAIHTTGRLKTRIRKLMSLLFIAKPRETMVLVAKYVPEYKLAVKFVHAFEGTKHAQTLEILMDLALTSINHFSFLAAYLDSLENDVWGDIWPAIQHFINQIASNASSTNAKTSNTKLEFLVSHIAPRFSTIKLRNYKKAAKEFADSYMKILVSEAPTTAPTIVASAIRQIPEVFVEADKQAAVLSRLIGLFIQKHEDVAAHTEILKAMSQTFSFAGTAPTRVWTKVVGDFLFEYNFLEIKVKDSMHLKPVVAQYMQCEKDRFLEFEGKLATYGASSNVLFNWTNTKTLADVNLRRLAYFVLCCPTDVLPLNLTKLTNQLTLMYQDHAAYVFMLIRVCMLREISAPMMMFAAFKLQHVLTAAAAEAHGSNDGPTNEKRLSSGNEEVQSRVLLEACKLLDLALVVQKEQFQLFEWLFVSNDGSETGGVLEKLANAPTVPDLIDEKQVDIYNNVRRRPLLPKRASAAELPLFLARVSERAFADCCSFQGVDMKYCEEWVLCDLFSS